MSHHALVNGTSYQISGGGVLVNSTKYSISQGKTLVGGTAYTIPFSKYRYVQLASGTVTNETSSALSLSLPSGTVVVYSQVRIKASTSGPHVNQDMHRVFAFGALYNGSFRGSALDNMYTDKTQGYYSGRFTAMSSTSATYMTPSWGSSSTPAYYVIYAIVISNPVWTSRVYDTSVYSNSFSIPENLMVIFGSFKGQSSGSLPDNTTSGGLVVDVNGTYRSTRMEHNDNNSVTQSTSGEWTVYGDEIYTTGGSKSSNKYHPYIMLQYQ